VASEDQLTMTQDAGEPILTALFVDYDNIYLSLKKRSEEAAKRFAKDAVSWLKEIEEGTLITATNAPGTGRRRRIVVNRCYGNPVPRRNPQDNSTDMTSFPFVRHHFLRAGFEVIDCPPLTAQLKNSSDIRMVMDANDLLEHATRFDEFIIMSGDADFTPLLHRLRAHARRTAIFANDFTAAAYTALCDGEVREAGLIANLLEGRLAVEPAKTQAAIADQNALERARAEIVATVALAVRQAGGPVPLEALAERTTRALGHDRTVGTTWAGAGSFLELLRKGLPPEIKLTDQPPYLAYEAARMVAAQQPAAAIPQQAAPQSRMIASQTIASQTLSSQAAAAPQPVAPPPRIEMPQAAPAQPRPAVRPTPAAAPLAAAPIQQPIVAAQPPQPTPQQKQAEMAAAIQASIARIHEACQAPPLSPQDYRVLFETIAAEINANGLQGGQTLTNIHTRTQQLGLSVSRDDIRFVMEVVSEADPWFEQGASVNLFAGRFRNFVVARCRSQNLNLSSDELDLVDAWFAGGAPVAPQSIRVPAGSANVPQQAAPQNPAAPATDEQFPKILRTRLRG
jgi:hypothetical protein